MSRIANPPYGAFRLQIRKNYVKAKKIFLQKIMQTELNKTIFKKGVIYDNQ